MTTSMGIPGQFIPPEDLRAIDAFLKVCRSHDIAPGTMSTGVEEAHCATRAGLFRCVAYWGVLWFYVRVLREVLADIRED